MSEFDTYWGYVRELTINQGSVKEKIFVRKLFVAGLVLLLVPVLQLIMSFL